MRVLHAVPRNARTLFVLMALACAVAVPASASASSATTLHFFNVGTSSTLTNSNGQPVGQDDPPAAGDRLVSEGLVGTGNRDAHSALAVGTSRLVCTFTSADSAVCTGKLTINEGAPDDQGVLFGKDVIVGFNSTGTTVVPLNGGTGRYAGLKSGSVTALAINDTGTSDFTVVYFT
jgi:hypothetical protein